MRDRPTRRGTSAGRIFYPAGHESTFPDGTRTAELHLPLDRSTRRPREAQNGRRRAQSRRRRALLAGALPLLLAIGLLVSQAAGSHVNLSITDRSKPSDQSQSAAADSAPAGSSTPGAPSSAPMTNPAPALVPGVEGADSASASTSNSASSAATADPTEAARPMAAGALVTWPSPLHTVLHDGGISVALPDGRSLWIFGDTTEVDRRPYFFVTSSGGVTSRGSTHLKYVSTSKGVPAEFLPRTTAERQAAVTGSSYTAVWPTGATIVPGGDILIGYAKYDVQMHPTSFTFESAGLYRYHYTGLSGLADGAVATRIADGIWTAADGAVGSPVYSGGYVYFTECQSLSCYSLRTTPGSATSKSSYTWWTGKGWSSSRADRTAMTYGASLPAASPSVAYLPAYGVYVTAGTATGHTAATGQLWVSTHPWGPWSKPITYALPDCPSAGCYSVQLHPLESTDGRIRVSYATAGVGPYMHVTDVPVKINSKTPSISLN